MVDDIDSRHIIRAANIIDCTCATELDVIECLSRDLSPESVMLARVSGRLLCEWRKKEDFGVEG